MDELYLRLVLEGDVSKYSYFIDKYKGMAFSIAYRIVNNREDAEEIVQDAFLKAFRSLGKFRGGSKFSTWFYRIVVNTSLTRVRSTAPQSSSLDENDAGDLLVQNVESTYRNLDLSEQKALINEALDELSMEDRLLLTLYYLNDDKLTRDILKKSYVELTDPEFSAATMKRIVRESWRRRIVNNFLVNLLVFIAIDALIWLGLRLTGMSAFELANRSISLLNTMLFQASELKEIVAGNHLATYLVLSIGGLAALLAILESRLSSWKKMEH